MLTKCICTNCAGHLEFEEENAGEKIKCPHCGFDTTLFLPGQQPDDDGGEDTTSRGFRPKKPVIIAAALLVVLAGAIFSLRRWVLPPLKDWLPYTDSRVLPPVVLALGCLGVLLLVVWTLFPVLFFFQMRKLTNVLQEIESNSRPTLSTEPIIEEEQVEPNSKSADNEHSREPASQEISRARAEI